MIPAPPPGGRRCGTVACITGDGGDGGSGSDSDGDEDAAPAATVEKVPPSPLPPSLRGDDDDKSMMVSGKCQQFNAAIRAGEPFCVPSAPIRVAHCVGLPPPRQFNPSFKTAPPLPCPNRPRPPAGFVVEAEGGEGDGGCFDRYVARNPPPQAVSSMRQCLNVFFPGRRRDPANCFLWDDGRITLVTGRPRHSLEPDNF